MKQKYSHACLDLSHLLRENNLNGDLSLFGDILDFGSFSVYFENVKPIFRDSNFDDNLVLVLTKDLEKKDFLTKLYSKHKDIRVLDLDFNSLDFDSMLTLTTLEAFGWHYFYVEKLIPNQFKNENSFGIQSLMSITKATNHFSITIKQLNPFSVIESMKEKALELALESGFEDYEFNFEEEEAYNAIFESLNLLKNSLNKDIEFRLDLHANQFVRYNEELICMDPVEFC